MVGRLFGGLATSLLFSVFEAWLVASHKAQGFPADTLDAIFSECTFLNGLIAIASGLMADLSVSTMGLLGPFVLSTLVLVIAFVLILKTWDEQVSKSQEKEYQWHQVLHVIWGNRSILSIGLIQCCMEAAMYAFVFLWAPVMEKQSKQTDLPLCMMMGSLLFQKLIRSMSVKATLYYGFVVCLVSFSIAWIVDHDLLVYLSFNCYEISIGLYFPAMSSLRSHILPDEIRSTVMNVFRVPLNLMVILMLRYVHEMNFTFVLLSFLSLLLLRLIDYTKPLDMEIGLLDQD